MKKESEQEKNNRREDFYLVVSLARFFFHLTPTTESLEQATITGSGWKAN